MRSLAFLVLWLCATALPGAEDPRLSLIFVGNAGTPRVIAFEELLAGHFAEVRIVGRDAFDPATARDADVVLLDWSQRDVDLRNMAGLKSPLGDRKQWSTPTVLLGSAGLLIAGPWRTNGAYG